MRHKSEEYGLWSLPEQDMGPLRGSWRAKAEPLSGTASEPFFPKFDPSSPPHPTAGLASVWQSAPGDLTAPTGKTTVGTFSKREAPPAELVPETLVEQKGGGSIRSPVSHNNNLMRREYAKGVDKGKEGKGRGQGFRFVKVGRERYKAL